MMNTSSNPLMTALNGWKKYKWTLYSVISAALGAWCIGSDVGYSAIVIPDINSSSGHFHLSNIEVAFVVSISSLGSLLAGPLAGTILDKSGRKFTLICATIPSAIGWLLIAIGSNFYCLCVGRFLTGISAGLMDASAPVYIAEISSASIRGFMGSCHELSTNIGQMYVYAFGTFLSWKWLAVACQAIPTLMILCLLFVPESPRWLMKVGMKEECLKTLKWLRSADEDINFEMNELETCVKELQLSQSEWKEFRSTTVYHPLSIIIGLLLFQQMSGYGVLTQYTVTILQDAGNKWDPFFLTTIIGAAGVVANVISALIVDRAGRRVMLLVSAILMAFSLTGLAVYFTLLEFDFQTVVSNDYSIVVFVCILIYNISVSLGYGPIPFYLASELLPLRVRGKASGLAMTSLWLFTFIAAFAFPYMVNDMGYHGAFWVMTGFGLFSIVFAFIFVPETKGMSLEQIEKRNL